MNDRFTKVKFIRSTLEKINRETLERYLTNCLDLIQTAVSLHKKYDGWSFFIKNAALKLSWFIGLGAAVGFTIGLVLPFLEIVETMVGAGLGLVMGLAVVIVKLIHSWPKMMNEIENTRHILLTIQHALEEILKQMNEANHKLGVAQTESKNQMEQNALSMETVPTTYQNAEDLEKYVLSTYDEFLELEKIIMKTSKN